MPMISRIVPEVYYMLLLNSLHYIQTRMALHQNSSALMHTHKFINSSIKEKNYVHFDVLESLEH